MKILYLSCHAILEYDELKLFEELGIDYFSLGSYIRPHEPVDPIRPALNHKVDEHLLSIAPYREALTPEFVDPFDAIIVMHVPEWIEKNWDVIKHKRVIWRTIGQSTPAIERRMEPYRAQGLEIVRYSPREHYLSDFAGEDALIRFYKDPEEFGMYNGHNKEIVTFAQNMAHRNEYCNYEMFKRITQGLPTHVYGPNNEASGDLNGGFLTYEGMRQKLRDSRVYVYTGTQPASYVLNFIEAWMTGIPIVALGPKCGNSLNIAGEMYEIQDLITSPAEGGICSDDVSSLRQALELLLVDHDRAKVIGKAGRERAIAIFGKDIIKSKWKKFLRI